MQICLSDMLSPNKFTSRHAANQINLCMLVLGELRESFYSADLTYNLFDVARQKIERRQRVQHGHAEACPETAAPAQQSTSITNREAAEDSERRGGTRQSGLEDSLPSRSEQQDHEPGNSLRLESTVGEESWQRTEFE